MNYRILRSTSNSGEYIGDQVASLREAKAIVKAERRNPATVVWRLEADEWAAYAHKDDLGDEDNAVARLRPVIYLAERLSTKGLDNTQAAC